MAQVKAPLFQCKLSPGPLGDTVLSPDRGLPGAEKGPEPHRGPLAFERCQVHLARDPGAHHGDERPRTRRRLPLCSSQAPGGGGGGFFPCHSQSCAAGKMLWDSQGRVWLRDASPFEAETSAAGW